MRRTVYMDATQMDVFDASGAYVGTLPTGTPFPVLLLRDGAVALVTTDDDEVQRLTVADVVVGPGN